MDKKKPTVLVVDDLAENIDVLVGVLSPYYHIKVAKNGAKAIDICKTSPQPDLILMDIMMPVMDGYTACNILKKDPLTKHIPLLFLTALSETEDEAKGLNLGAEDYITKPIKPEIVLARVKTHLALFNQNRALDEKVKLTTEELNHTRLEIIQKLGRAAEYKDNETGLHVIRMSHYAKSIAQQLGYDDRWVELIFQAAPMHDIGKIGIPDKILTKPGKLDDEEWNVMAKHPEIGADIIGEGNGPLLELAREIALSHHEKWDGSGYPYALKGEDIPLSGRIIAIADVFDALTSERPYKKSWDVEKAVDYIMSNAGTHFDPHLTPHFNKLIPEFLTVRQQFWDTH
jgi:putative two-component system response regulator